MIRNNLSDLSANGNVGDWCFSRTGKSIFICYPYPDEIRGRIAHITIFTELKEKVHIGWLWNGDREKPTIEPSIHIPGIWRGHLQEGKLITIEEEVKNA